MKKKFLVGSITIITATLAIYFIKKELRSLTTLFDEDELDRDEFDI